MNSFEGKRILALVRDAAYAHAGEEEAIALALGGIAKEHERRVFDVGCGLGGTAEYRIEAKREAVVRLGGETLPVRADPPALGADTETVLAGMLTEKAR